MDELGSVNVLDANGVYIELTDGYFCSGRHTLRNGKPNKDASDLL